MDLFSPFENSHSTTSQPFYQYSEPVLIWVNAIIQIHIFKCIHIIEMVLIELLTDTEGSDDDEAGSIVDFGATCLTEPFYCTVD